MPRHKLSHRHKRARPPRKLLAWRKRARRRGELVYYNGVTIPKFHPLGMHQFRTVADQHIDRKRAIQPETA